jgi:hypothetical protein
VRRRGRGDLRDLRERAAGQAREVGQRVPFGLPAAERALMLLHHRREHGRHEVRRASRR